MVRPAPHGTVMNRKVSGVNNHRVTVAAVFHCAPAPHIRDMPDVIHRRRRELDN